MGVASDALRPTILTGQWGLLRPLEAARDAADLYRLTHGAHAAELWADMKIGPFPSGAAFRTHLEDMLADPSRSFFAIAAPDGAALGWLCLMEVQWAHLSMELGYVMFGPPLQRTRLATEAFFLIMSHIFDDLAFERLEWPCAASNLKSRKAASRLGFQFEGLMRHKLILKGVTHDIPLYSLLATEWPARKLAMQRWLSPSNFINGEQISPLG
ncbi:MAG: N-acetyltransferase [Hyphomicrobiales bacterium]|nr:MAG: N-acetyltransferase [Hyphomicrobiales bacterium]